MCHFVSVEALNCAIISPSLIRIPIISCLWSPVVLYFLSGVVGTCFVPGFLVVILIAIIPSTVVLTINFERILSIKSIVIRVLYLLQK